MVRSARLVGLEEWHAMGDVSLIDAAKQFCMTFPQLDKQTVEVCCDSDPGKIYTFDMVRVLDYRCVNPRQGMVD